METTENRTTKRLLRLWTLTLDLVMLVLLLAAPVPAPAYARVEPSRPTR